MNRQLLVASLFVLTTATAFADVRVNLNLGIGHPLRRPGRTVIVRPLRPNVVVRPNVTYVAPVRFTRTAVVVPPRQRIVWEDSEVIRRNEDWVDTSLSVRNRGDRLLLQLDGRGQVDFAEVHFANGQVQVVDFQDGPMEAGAYGLIDFADGRQVDFVRIVARARSPQLRLSVMMVK